MAKKSKPKDLDSIVSDESKTLGPMPAAPEEDQDVVPAEPAVPAAPVAAAAQPVKPKRRKAVVSPFDGLLRENTYTPFALSDDDAFIQYNDSEHQVRIRWDPYSDAKLYVQTLAKNIDIEANPQVFKQGFVVTGLARWLARYGLSADDINSIKPKQDDLAIDDLTLKFNDPENTNYYVLPFGKLSEGGKPVNVVCDTKQLRAIALYYKGDKKPSSQFHAGLGMNIAPIVRFVGNQKEVTGWTTRVGSRTAAGYAIIAVPDKTQINMISPGKNIKGGSVETVKGQVFAYTDNLELKVSGVAEEWAITGACTAAGAAAGFFLAPSIVLNPVTTAAVGFAAGGYLANLIASTKENTTVGDYMRQAGIGALGGVGGAGLTYLALTAGAATVPWLMPAVLAAEGMAIGHATGRLASGVAVNPENVSLTKRLGAALYFTEENLHTLAMRNKTNDYGFCITS